METLLKYQDAPPTSEHVHEAHFAITDADPNLYIATGENGPLVMRNAYSRLDSASGPGDPLRLGALGDSTMDNTDPPLENISLGWDMISLGVEEALPTPEVQEALCVVLF